MASGVKTVYVVLGPPSGKDNRAKGVFKSLQTARDFVSRLEFEVSYRGPYVIEQVSYVKGTDFWSIWEF